MMLAASEPSASRRLQTIALIAFVGFVVVLALIVSATRGPYFDEMWTMWMSAPELGIGDTAHQLWFNDVHPPLYYMLNRLVWPVLGEDIFWHRLTNLVPLAMLLGLAVHLARSVPAMRGVVVVVLVLVLSNPDVGYLIEYRSYTTILCAATAVLLLLYRVVLLDGDLDLARDRGLMILLLGTLLLAFNLHYFASLICGVAVGVVALDRLWLRRSRWAAFLILCTVVASVPLLASLAAERAYMAKAVPDFWIDTSPLRTVGLLVQVGLESFGFNVVLAACLFLVVRSTVQRRAAADQPVSPQWRFALLMAAAALLASGLILAASLVRPMVVARYLVALTPIYAIALGALTERLLLSRAWLFSLFVLNAAIAAVIPFAQQFDRPLWNESASVIAGGVRACPAARVYALERHDLPPAMTVPALPNAREFIHWALPRLGRQHGFAAEPVTPGDRPHPRSPAPCPTFVWSEHVKRNAPEAVGTIRAAGLEVAQDELQDVRRFDSRSGFVLIVPPLRAQAR
jgi:hypothetical protein